MTRGRFYKDFWLDRTGGHDTPWIGRHHDGRKYRADTLLGLKQLITEMIRIGD